MGVQPETEKKENISPVVKEWLLANRTGKLHSAQWRELVTEPLVPLLLLMVPGIMLLRSFIVSLFVGSFWMVGIAGLVSLAFMLIIRARRYARLPIQVATLRAIKQPPPTWMFWKAWEFDTAAGTKLFLHKSLLPDHIVLESGKNYLVYYLSESDRHILLSLAASDHPDSGKWQPTTEFRERLKRRTSVRT
ncbi:MAG: hypothetical protein R3E39_14095 [Anaerolineae bacterium]